MNKEPKKKTQIKSGAKNLFNQFGFKKVTVEEICQTAGASKMTFYKYFANKNELIKHLWQKIIEDNMAKLEALDKTGATFQEKVRMLLKLKAEATTAMGDQYIKDYLDVVPELQDFYNQMLTKVMQWFIKIIQQAQEKGEVRKSIRPEFFLAIVNQLLELSKNEQLVALYDNYTEFALEVNNFMYYGLMPVPDEDKK
ncbi:MAG TPA: TetR/AcrR family transcriptional regulator [Candidatus Marinimicrobia bacterium]|nr:TetR/AcrR family transcriptional regulator [Candidatus Neomarinimicrobiota bacterium]